MIKEKEILVKINSRNITHYSSLGYTISNEILVSTVDVLKGSKIRITGICSICKNEVTIALNKYYLNKERNNKGYYSCFMCKTIEKEKTCIKKYGVKSFSQTDEFKNLDKSNWNYEEGFIKGKKTKLEKYGVDSYFKLDIMKKANKIWMSSEEFKEKSKKTIIKKYGVDSYSKSIQFKKTLFDNKETILNKIKETFMLKYGVDWYSKTNEWYVKYSSKLEELRKKSIKTCVDKYGVENVTQVKEIYDKILNTKITNGFVVGNDDLTDWQQYKKKVLNLTRKVKKQLYENWDGYDYYDNEFIKGNNSYLPTHRFYPTIDHKISTFYGYSNNISPEEISNLNNLCITKRYINSSKNSLIEEIFIKL